MTRRSWRWALLLAALAAAALVVGPEAWARVGGGQSYGGSHSSRSSGGSDGGGDLGLVLFLIQLVIEVPALGIPLGGCMALGTSPVSRMRVRCTPGSGRGMADSRAWV